MDEGVKQVIIVAIAVVVGLALILLFKSDGNIMKSIGTSISGMIDHITDAAGSAAGIGG